LNDSASYRLFHAVKVNAARPDDFKSMLANERLPRLAGSPNPATLRRAAGVSCYATVEQARQAATRFGLGAFIAELEIPIGPACYIEVARTGRSEGHYTVWASPEYLASRVVNVEPIGVVGS